MWNPFKTPVKEKKVEKDWLEAEIQKIQPEKPIEIFPPKQEPKILEKHQGLGWRDKNKLGRKPTTTYLVTMIFGNGSCKHFVVEPDTIGFFKFRKNKYHINQKNVIWDANENTNRLFYHENYVEPLEIKEVYVNESENRMIAYVTPDNVDGVIKMESLRLIAEGPDLQKWVRISVFVSIAVLVLLMIILIIFLAQSGIFQQIKGAVAGSVR